MITRVTVRNYRCLGDVTVAMGPFTVLAGPNGAGKSAFLAALKPRELSTLSDFRNYQTVSIERLIEFDDGPPAWLSQAKQRVKQDDDRPWRDYHWRLVRFD